MPIQDN
jgi:hypothetical protein